MQRRSVWCLKPCKLVSAYLGITTEPECEYLDGELFPKARGTNLHGRLQGRLFMLLFKFEERGVGQVVTEQSVRLRDYAVLIPDVAILARDNQELGLVSSAPLLCIEMLSPSDRFTFTIRKCEEYLKGGFPVCWIFDPEQRGAWVHGVEGIRPVASDGLLQAGEIFLSMQDVFPA